MVLRTAVRHTDYRAKKNLYPPRIGHVLTFGLAPYILYMYKPSIRVSKGFFWRSIPHQITISDIPLNHGSNVVQPPVFVTAH